MKNPGKTVIYLLVWMMAVVTIAALCGCGADPVPVQPTAQIVKVPVITPCIDAIPQPDDPFLTDAQLLDGTDYQVVNNLRIDRDKRRQYESVLVSTMQACVK